jgi:quinohemoprotein ethanol dehydrogenase
VADGAGLYVTNCIFCHGTPAIDIGGNVPNLGYLAPETLEHLSAIVLGGSLSDKGMPDFTGKLSGEDIEKIKAFIQNTAEAVKSQ